MNLKIKRVFGILISLALVLGLMLGMSLTAYAEDYVAKVGETGYTNFSDAVTAWTNGNTLTLLKDVITNTIGVSGTKTLDLNGHGLRGSGSGSVINVTGNLTLIDSNPTSTTHYFDVNTYRAVNVNDTSGTYSFHGGYITGGSSDRGGGICISGGSVTMNGGTILGNSASFGAGVGLGGNASFTMNGGEICYNATVEDNGHGGGIGADAVDNTTITINSGYIRHNTCYWSGGGISSYWGRYKTLKVYGGTITYNQSLSSGNEGHVQHPGGIGVQGTFKIHGNPQIYHNRTGMRGGTGKVHNVYLFHNSTITLDGNLETGCLIGVTLGNSNNDAPSEGTITEFLQNHGTISNFASDIGGYSVKLENNEAYLYTHTHGNYTYSATGNVITATCGNNSCSDPVYSATLTIIPPESLQYTGTPKEAIIQGLIANVDNPQISYQKKNEKGEFVSCGTPVDEGTYRASMTLGNATAQTEYTITGIMVTAEGYTGPYDASPHSIKVTVTEPSGTEIEYCETEGGTYSSQNPAYTNVGTYTVYYRAKKAGYIPVTGSQDVKIEQASIADASVTLSATTLDYSGSEQTVTVTEVKLGDTKLTADVDYTVTGETTGTNKGTYTVTVTGKGNYKDFTTAQWSIGLATPIISMPPTASAITYGQTLKDSTLSGGVAKNGNEDVEGTFSWKNAATSPAVSDSETTEYDVIFTPKDTDNYGIAECKVKLTVNKASGSELTDDQKPTAKTDLVYTGEKQELINEPKEDLPEGYTQIVYAVTTEKTAPTDESAYTSSIPTGINVGTYYVWYKAGGDENHTDSDPEVVSVIIAEPDTYTVTVTNDGHGTGSATPTSGVEGTEVTLAAAAAEGYQFKEWQVVSGGVTVAENKFKIGTANVEIKAVFEEIPADVYTITVTNDGHGTGSATPASGVSGTEVVLAATAAEGYKFKEWQVVSGGVTIAENKFTIGTANVEIKAVFEQAGDMEDEVIVEPGAPAVSGTNIDEVAAGVVTADEVAAGVKVWVDISPLAEAAVPAGDKALANHAMQGFGGTAGAWIDMSMFKQVTGQSKTAVHQTATAFRFSMKISDSLKKAGRTFWLLRLHNDKADILATTTGDTLSGETNLFSTYLIAYKDAETPTPTPTPTPKPKPVPRTGDGAPLGLWIGLIAVGLIGLGTFIAMKRRTQKK